MAAHGTLDVVVHFHRFRNVDLFSRGIYMIRVSVSTSKQVGIPYACYSKPSTMSTFVRNQEIPAAHASTLPAAQIVDDTSEFSTRAFVIKYRDERLDLNEGCQFQLLLESSVDDRRLIFEKGEAVVLKLDLLMAELEKPQKTTEKKPATSVAAEKPSAAPLFTRIASQTLNIVCDPASQQLHAYYPVTFSAMHFCQLDMTVHTALINLKFRKRAYSRSSVKADDDQGRVLASSSPQVPEHFHELLFPDSSSSEETVVDPDEARDVHHAYLQPMLQSLGATAAALRNMRIDVSPKDDDEAPSSKAVAGVMALIKQPYAEGSPFGFLSSKEKSSVREPSEEVEPLTPVRIANCVEADVKLVARRLFLLWGRFVAQLPQSSAGGQGNQLNPTGVVARLQRTWLGAQRRFWASRLKNHYVKVQKILQPREPTELDSIFTDLRSSNGRNLAVFDQNLLKDPSLLPVCASHVYVRREQVVPPGDNNISESSSSDDVAAAAAESPRVLPSPEPPAIWSFSALAATVTSTTGRPPTPPEEEEMTKEKPFVHHPGIPTFDDDSENYRGPHLIVMQHGWYASSFDMRLLRAFALLLFPRAVVLSPQSNEDNTGGSIGPMGQRLAHEVHNFIKHRCHELTDPDPNVGRISFIGHSAGSIITRTALTAPVFAPYLPKLHAFISLSSSHCGNLFVPSTLISGGMWALQRLHHSTFMNELQLLDDKDMTKTFMYNLSKAKGFELFRYVVLVGSCQDSYVPMHTAQATIPRPAEAAQQSGNMYVQMAANLMQPITSKTPDHPKQTTVVRMTLDHKFTQTNLDTVIGRAAHLAYIDSSPAVLLLLFSLYNILK